MKRPEDLTDNLERLGIVLIANILGIPRSQGLESGNMLESLIESINTAIVNDRRWSHELVYSLECGQYPRNIRAFYIAKEFRSDPLVTNKIFELCLDWLFGTQNRALTFGGSFGFSSETLFYILCGLACQNQSLYAILAEHLSRFSRAQPRNQKVLPIEATALKRNSLNANEKAALVNATTLCNPNHVVELLQKDFSGIDIAVNSFHGLWGDHPHLFSSARNIWLYDYSRYYRYSGHFIFQSMAQLDWLQDIRHNDRLLVDDEAAIWANHLRAIATTRYNSAMSYQKELLISQHHAHTVIPEHPLPELIPFVSQLKSNSISTFSLAFHVDRYLYSPIHYLWISKFDYTHQLSYKNYAIYNRYGSAATDEVFEDIRSFALERFNCASYHVKVIVYNYSKISDIADKSVINTLLVDSGPLLSGSGHILPNEKIGDFLDRIAEISKISCTLFGIRPTTLRLRPNCRFLNSFISRKSSDTLGVPISTCALIEDDIKRHDLIITSYPTTATFDALLQSKPCISFVRTSSDAANIDAFHGSDELSA